MSKIEEVRERLEEVARACELGDWKRLADDLRALLADHARMQARVVDLEGSGSSYWRVEFRMYADDTETCVLFVDLDAEPTLDSLGVTPRPFELVSVEKKHVNQHRWDAYGERCLDCGDKDWMNDPKCRPVFDTAKAVQR